MSECGWFSLGASRASVVAQLLTEPFILALCDARFGVEGDSCSSRNPAAYRGDQARLEDCALFISLHMLSS